MKKPIGWFEIYVSDMDRAKAFSEAVLDVELTQLFDPTESGVDMRAFPSDMEKYGATGALAKMEGMPAGQNSVMVYFSCDDCETEEARIEDAGGKVQRPKFSIGEYGFITIATDTEGNMFGLHSMQ